MLLLDQAPAALVPTRRGDPTARPGSAPAAAVETIDTYVAAWNETDPAARNALVERSLGADLWYRDPMLEADGLAAFDAMVAAVQAQFPGQGLHLFIDRLR